MIQNIKKITLLSALVISFSSFIFLQESDTKIFGVSEDDASQIELALHADQHFTYRDYSDVDNKIDVQGEWKQIKNHIQLFPNGDEQDFHTKWKISEDGNFARSRNKLCFYTLKRLK